MVPKNENVLGTANSSSRQTNMATRARELQALGNLCSINPDARSIPVPSSYLHPMAVPGPSRYGPPPLPPRRTSTYPSSFNRMGGMGGMGSYYSPYSRYSSFGYSSPYSGYRMGPYGQFGTPNDSGNSFIQMAEESTRPAFESIESVVEVVSSISMMLESTYHAVHSSYSAILGVVDQFSRLKDHLAQIFSVLALLRGLRWLCLKVLYLLGLRKDNPSVDAAWNSAEQQLGSSGVLQMPDGAQVSVWPFLMFMGLVIGAPWLMFKLLSKTVATKKGFDRSQFIDENGKGYLAIAAYDFNATQPGELSFRAGEKLFLSPKSSQNKGWTHACNVKKEIGLIPNNYLAVKRKQNVRNAEASVQVPLQENTSIPDDIPFQVTVPPTDLENAFSSSQTPVDHSVDALDKTVDENIEINN